MSAEKNHSKNGNKKSCDEAVDDYDLYIKDKKEDTNAHKAVTRVVCHPRHHGQFLVQEEDREGSEWGWEKSGGFMGRESSRSTW